MAFVPATNVAEVKFSHTLLGAPDKGWVLHYVQNPVAAWTIAKLEDLAAACITWWDVHMQPLMNTSTRLDRVRIRDITTESGLQVDSTAGLPLTGSRAGTAAPPQVVLSIKKSTGFTGKTFRGRVYQFGMVTADLGTPVLVTSTYLNLVEAAWNEALFLVGGVGNYDLVLVSRQEDGQPRATGQIAIVTNMAAVDQRIDTNRKKLPRGSA